MSIRTSHSVTCDRCTRSAEEGGRLNVKHFSLQRMKGLLVSVWRMVPIGTSALTILTTRSMILMEYNGGLT